MTNQEKYISAFTDALDIKVGETETLNYGQSSMWDSVGHMRLIANLEDTFDIMMDMDDIIDFSSFAKGKEILRKYNVEI